VVVVLNGDEVIVEKNGDRATLRMLGIRSFDPVVNEFEITAFGRASVSFLYTWVLNKAVRVGFDTTIKDVRGRYLGFLDRDGVDINRRMVEEGVAMVYTEYPFAREAEYLSTEVLARAAGRGIWGGQRTRTRIRALRHDWDSARHQHGGTGSADPLLLESP
jgi:endonuclease YncB( thermonuclease family)